MANTTNLNLVKPAGTDYAMVSVINGNMDIIDSKVGAIPANESAQSQITALNNQIPTEIEKRLFVDKRNATSYQIPITGKDAGAYWFALMYSATSSDNFSVYSIFINGDGSVVKIDKLIGSDTRTYTGSVSGSVLTITVNDNLTVWAGIRVIKMN